MLLILTGIMTVSLVRVVPVISNDSSLFWGPFFIGTLSAFVVYRSSKYLSGLSVRQAQRPFSK